VVPSLSEGPIPGGKTPHATLHAAILREITVNDKDVRFQKPERGHFALAK